MEEKAEDIVFCNWVIRLYIGERGERLLFCIEGMGMGREWAI